MSDSYSAYQDDIKDYTRLCKLLGVQQKTDFYDHLEELKQLPPVYWEKGSYKIDKKKYPEYFI